MRRHSKYTKRPKGCDGWLPGFTLIELLIVIIIITALAVVVFVALNPVKRLQDARNARRVSDAQSILTAIHEYSVDILGSLPPGLSSGMAETQLGIGGGAAACGNVVSGGCNVKPNTPCVDLSGPLSKYLKSIPIDPLSGSAAETMYTASVSASNIITINACGTEGVNLLPNPSFENLSGGSLSWWWLYVNTAGGAAATLNQDISTQVDGNASAHILVTQSNVSHWEYVELGQNISLDKTLYTLSYWAKASTNRQMVVDVQQNYSPNTIYATQTVNLTTNWQQYTLTFTPSQADSNSVLVFDADQANGDVWIDRVCFGTCSFTTLSE